MIIIELRNSTVLGNQLKFGAVLSIIYGFLMAVLYLDPFTAMNCGAVVSEDAKTMLACGLTT